MKVSQGLGNVIRGGGHLLSRTFKSKSTRELVENSFNQLGDALVDGLEIEVSMPRVRRVKKGGPDGRET